MFTIDHLWRYDLHVFSETPGCEIVQTSSVWCRQLTYNAQLVQCLNLYRKPWIFWESVCFVLCVCVFFNSGWFFRRQVLGVSFFFFFGWRPGCGNVWENSREIPKMVCTKMTWTAVICCGFYGFLFGRQMMEPYVPYFGPAIHDRRLNCSLCKRFLWHCMTRD